LRFIAALAPAHLLQNSRDTKALHPVFFRLVLKDAVLSPAFSEMPETPSCDLRNFLTAFREQGGNWESLSAPFFSPSEKWSSASYCLKCSHEHILGEKRREIEMKTNSARQLNPVENDSFSSTTTIAALLFLAAKFPYRQFNSAELCILSGIGRTAMSQIKNAADTPFSLGKCTLQRLDAWLAKRPGFKQQ
jgi:hypothetical protein